MKRSREGAASLKAKERRQQAVESSTQCKGKRSGALKPQAEAIALKEDYKEKDQAEIEIREASKKTKVYFPLRLRETKYLTPAVFLTQQEQPMSDTAEMAEVIRLFGVVWS